MAQSLSMNGELSLPLSDDERQAAQVAANVLDSSAIIRARQQEISDRLAEIARKRAEHEGSAENALLSEMQLMADRMRWLHEHPWRARHMGKHALAVISNEEHMVPLRTEPAPDGMIGVHEGKELVVSGLMYSSGFYDDDMRYLRVNVSRLIENQNLREASRTQKLYNLSTYKDDIGWRVLPSGSEFRPLEEQKERELQEHQQRREADIKKRLRSRDVRTRAYAQLQMYFDGEREERESPERITPPDDMYLRPLALVMQGNMLLGAKRKQP